MRARSLKTQRKYRQRRKLVAELLTERPKCQRCRRARSTQVHELLSRARGGSILDEANCVALCGGCHEWVTEHPAQAALEGWLLHSWETP